MPGLITEKYQIETSDYRCDGCEREIPFGAEHFSAVLFESDRFARRDYCVPCWNGPRSGSGAEVHDLSGNGFYAFWRRRRPEQVGQAPRRVRLDTGLVFEFFRRLSGVDGAPPEDAAGTPVAEAEDASSGSPNEAPSPSFPAERRNLRFVLALLLIRKKALVFETGASRDGREWLKLSEKADPDRVHWVENPELSDDELERVRDGLASLLEMNV